MKIKLMLLLTAISLFGGSRLFAQKGTYDVCVYGETPAGITAAIQAARMGKKVVLLSTGKHLGGVMTSGLTATDINNYRAIGGIGREVFQRLYTYYLNPAVWKSQQRDEYFEFSKKRTFTGKNDSLKMQWVYESHILESIFKQMLKEAGVDVVYKQKIKPFDGVIKDGPTIKSLVTLKGNTYVAKIFIDASYEGDLMADAKVTYVIGRESNAQYGETFNGIRLGGVIENENQPIDPYIKSGDPKSGVLPFIEPKVAGPDGSSDKRSQAYTYRVTLTDDPANRIDIKKPKDYNPLWFELIARRLAINPALKLTSLLSFTPMPNKKTDSNQMDFVGANYEYPDGSYEVRRHLDAMHKSYVLGMIWFLGNDERVPENLRTEMKRWGLPKDEFKDSGHFPTQIYVREARRMVGSFVMKEQNCTSRQPADQSVGLGTYMLDCHYVSRMVDSLGRVHIEGTYAKNNGPYTIGYQALVPKTNDCVNLIVPVCLSATHVAYASIRMEPTFMVLGQSAGAAAALAIANACPVQQVPYPALKAQLLKDGQIISLPIKKF